MRPARDPDASRQPDATRDGGTVARRRMSALDREPGQTPSNPSAARDVVRRQSSSAAALTGSRGDGSDSLFRRLAAEDDSQTSSADFPSSDNDSELASDADSPTSGSPADSTSSFNIADSPTSGSAANSTTSADQAERAAIAGQNEPADVEEKLDHLVEDPIEQEQRTDIEAPSEFEVGSSAPPPPPDFTGQTPTESRPLPTGGTEQTYVQGGVTYTHTTRPDGSVSTSYERNGTDYSTTTQANGGSTVLVSADTDSGLHTRTITTTADGQVTDNSHSTQAVIDPETGDMTQQSRSETVGPDDVRSVEEQVYRPDGGRATVNRTQQPDGSYVETYSYEGDDGTVNRTTTAAADGTSEIRRERAYTSDLPLEEVVNVPPVPDEAGNVVPLPQDGRSPTQVHDVTVSTTGPSGSNPEVQYEESTYSQTSSAVAVTGSGVPSEHDPWRDTWPTGVVPDPDGTSVTHSVSTVSSRDPETDEMTSTTGASQTVTLAATRHPDFPAVGDGELTVTRVDSWNSEGASAVSYSARGFTRGDLFAQSQAQADTGNDALGPFGVDIGGQHVAAGPPDTGKGIYDHLNMKGGGDAEDWIGAGPDDILDVDVTVARDNDGDEVHQNITYSTIDDDGNGRSVSRSEAEGAPVGWVYSDFSNDGQDYRRQTVFEGTKISVYEERVQTGEGTFEAMSETTDDGVPIASTSSSRSEASEADLRAMVGDGELDQGQLDRLLSDGPPYYVSRSLDNTEAIYDGDELRRDEDGNPIQPGHHVSSYEVEGSDGYAVSEHYRVDYGETPSQYTDSRLSATTDPDGTPPYQARIETRDSGTVTDSGEVMVDALGRLTYENRDGEITELGQYDLEGTDIGTLIREGDDFDPLSAISPSVRAGQLVPEAPGGRLRLSGDDARFQGLGYVADVLGVYSGARSVWDGISGGDARQVVEGLGGIAGGVESVAAATSALTSKVGLHGISSYADEVSALTKAGRFGSSLGRALGAVGGFIQFGFGVHDLINADSGHDRAAAGLNVAAGVVAVGGAFLGPPGWVVGGLISGGLSVAAYFVGSGDDNDTLDIDERLQ